MTDLIEIMEDLDILAEAMAEPINKFQMIWDPAAPLVSAGTSPSMADDPSRWTWSREHVPSVHVPSTRESTNSKPIESARNQKYEVLLNSKDDEIDRLRDELATRCPKM
jgi:hypothetical protein